MKGNLSAYYRSEGEEDPVIISFPQAKGGKRVKFEPGEAYDPKFNYNPLHPHTLECRAASHVLRQMSFVPALASLGRFSELQDLPGIAAAAKLGQAEVYLSLALNPGWLSLTGLDHLQQARELADKSIEMAPTSWKGLAVLGLILILQLNDRNAITAFDRAIELDKQSVEGYYGYVIFLIIGGLYRKALHFAALNAANHVEDAMAQAFVGLLHYSYRNYKEAERNLSNALYLDKHCWLAHISCAVLHVTLGNGELAERHLSKASFELESWSVAGLDALCVARCEDASLTHARKSWHDTRWGLKHFATGENLFQKGVAAIAGKELFDRWFPWKSHERVLEIASGNLLSSFDKRYPLSLFLHLWPFLDPVRSAVGYKAGLKERKFLDPPIPDE